MMVLLKMRRMLMMKMKKMMMMMQVMMLIIYIYNIGSCSLEGALRRCFGAKHQTNVKTSKP